MSTGEITFTPTPVARFTCELPGCGRSTLAARYSDCQIWLDNTPAFHRMLSVCPEHKAEWLRIVSDFMEGDLTAVTERGYELPSVEMERSRHDANRG